MTDAPTPPVGAEAAAERATQNTAVRAGAELIGKFASLALLAALARSQGPVGLGVFLLALAWCELTATPIEMGFDTYLLRRVAADRANLESLFGNVLALKLLRTVPVVAVSWILASLTHQSATTREAIYVLTAALLIESVRYTVFAVFDAFERGELVATSLLTHRLLGAGLGILALGLGYGVVAVAVAYTAGAAAALGVAIWLLVRRVRWPGLRAPRQDRRELRRRSLPFATQDILSIGIARFDTILLSALATKAVVGLYGAAYRLLEATLFVSNALAGAFTAMFTYLSKDSDPPIREVFQRALKATLALLVPGAVTLAVLAEPVLRLFFGPGFEDGVGALRILAAVVVVLGVVRISNALVLSRGNPNVLAWQFALALVVNVTLNVVLIPPFEATGAALAMLGTELLLAIGMLWVAIAAVGPPRAAATLAGPLLGAAAMAAAMWPLRDELLPALPLGVVAYLAVFVAIERRTSPEDLRFLTGLVRRGLRSRVAA